MRAALLWDAHQPQRGCVELALPHFPDVHPDPFITSLVCCGSACAEKWSYRIQSMWMLWFESLSLVFCQSSANLAVRCLFSIQLWECLQIIFQCWTFLWSVRMCCVCQNYFIQVCQWIQEKDGFCNSVHVSESSLSDWFIRVWTQLLGCCHSPLSRVHLLGCWCSNFLKILVEKWGLEGESGF